jgi:hypothetical protein
MIDNNNNGIDDSIEMERYTQELERDRRKWVVRRRMAITSLIFLIIFGVYYSLIGIFIDESQARNMSEFNGIVVSIIGALASLLLGYYGTAYFNDKDKTNKDK